MLKTAMCYFVAGFANVLGWCALAWFIFKVYNAVNGGFNL